MKKKWLLSVVVIVLMLLSACSAKPEKESIVIGLSRSITGPLAVFEQTAFGPIYKMWVDEVNADGGIYVEEYGKKLPIVLKVYDDESDITKMTENMIRLIIEDEVDFLLPPAGTDMLFAAAPIVSEYGYILIGAEGGSTELSKEIINFPNVFSVLSFSTHNQVPVLTELLKANDVQSVAMIYLSDLHGKEYASATIESFNQNGIDIVISRSIPVGIEDMSPIIMEAKDADVDAFLIYAYPDENFLALGQSMALGFNPKVFLIGPGANFQAMSAAFGPAADGVMGWGAWNAKSSPAHKELVDKLTSLYGLDIIDWWGHNIYYASLQLLQEAIERAGTLDQEVIKNIIETEKFDTILGSTWFDDNHMLALECYTGQVGQWQNGLFEVIGPIENATAEILYPKPDWPAPSQE